MAYLDYEYNANDTFENIAKEYGVDLTELYKVNNLTYPYPDKPSEVLLPGETVKIPFVLTGSESVENRVRETVLQQTPVQRRPDSLLASSLGAVGYYSQKECYIQIRGVKWFFPGWPDSYSDSRQANFTSQHPLGRSEPFQIYQNSGPRTVSVSFTMHREMEHIQPIDQIVAAVQSAVYPTGDEAIVPKVILVLGNNCYIEGVISGNVGTEWSNVINKKLQYNMVTLSFTITECTGEPKTANDVLRKLGV